MEEVVHQAHAQGRLDEAQFDAIREVLMSV